MSLFQSDVIARTTDSVLTFFIFSDEENALELNPSYQRDYEWDKVAAQALFHTAFNTLPMGSISIINDNKLVKSVEVVDGKQRLTTLLDFVAGRIPAYKSKSTGLILHPDELNTDDAVKFYHSDLSPDDKRTFKKMKLPCVELRTNDGSPVSELQKLKYFHRVNFSGIPISDEHRKSVEAQIKKLEEI
jgi:hypothetical protein